MIRFIATLLLLVLAGAVTAQIPDLDEVRRLLRDGRFEEALVAIDARLAAQPDDRQTRFLKGVALAETQDAEGAIREFTALTRDHPELPEPYNNLAVVYASQGEYDKARDALLDAINTHPSYATAHENLGDIYAKLAGLAYTRALSLDTANAGAKNKLALIDDLFSREPLPASAPPALATRSTPAARPASVAPARIASAGGEPPPARAASAGGSTPPPTRVASASGISPPPSPPPPAAAARSPPGDTAAGTGDAVPLDGGAVEAVQQWAAAWSSRDVDAYLAAYAPEISPDPILARAAWVQQRRDRLGRPAFIDVQVDELRVRRMDADRVTVTFEQRYRSDTYQDRVRKELSLRYGRGGWKITSERTLEKLP